VSDASTDAPPAATPDAPPESSPAPLPDPGPLGRDSGIGGDDTVLSRARFVVRWAVVAATIAAGLGFAAGVALDVVRPWLYGFRPWWVAVAGYRFLGPHPPLAWLLAALLPAVGIAVVAALGRSRRLWFRIPAGLAGVAGLVLLGLAVSDIARFGVGGRGGLAAVPWDVFTGLCATVLGGGLAAWGRLGEPPRGRLWRWAPVPVAAVLVAVLGYPTLDDAWRWYRPQELRAFHAELVRARRAFDSEIVDERAETVEANGSAYLVDRGDTLKLGPDDVARVLWIPAGDDGPAALGLRLRAGLAGALARRCDRGIRQYGAWDSDALFVDGKLFLVASYQGLLLDGRMTIRAGEDETELRALYKAFTGEDAP
jgi:hypothetical protein